MNCSDFDPFKALRKDSGYPEPRFCAQLSALLFPGRVGTCLIAPSTTLTFSTRNAAIPGDLKRPDLTTTQPRSFPILKLVQLTRVGAGLRTAQSRTISESKPGPFSQGGSKTPSVVGVRSCQPWYWSLSALQIPLAIFCTSLVAHRLAQQHHKRLSDGDDYHPDELHFGPKQLVTYPLIALVAGVIAGLLGIGERGV